MMDYAWLISVLFQILVAWLFADFVTGLFHWWEDRYLDDNQTLEFFQGVAQDNKRHHQYPTALCMCSWWENMRSAAIFASPVGFGLWLIDMPIWFWMGIYFTGFGNLIHRFSHEPKRKLNWFILAMQKTGLFISHEHHAKHHYFDDGKRVDPKWNSTRTYCPMTNWVNPILDGIGFWWAIESLLKAVGIRPIG
ncbi:MAG: fatty acid desaturase CarF family protein [Pirellulales bacterium]